MPPTKLVTEPWVCLRCAHRATFATGRARRPPPPSQYKARPRPSKVLASRQRPWTQSSKELSKEEPEQKLTLSDALRDTKKEDNSLLSPVYIPEDPTGVLNERHPATHILTNSGIVIQRQLELANVMLGFEQANKYVILDPQGNHIGFMAEQDNSVGTTVARQILSTHRSFTTHVFDKHEKEVLRVWSHGDSSYRSPNTELMLHSSIDPSHGCRPVSVCMTLSRSQSAHTLGQKT